MKTTDQEMTNQQMSDKEKSKILDFLNELRNHSGTPLEYLAGASTAKEDKKPEEINAPDEDEEAESAETDETNETNDAEAANKTDESTAVNDANENTPPNEVPTEVREKVSEVETSLPAGFAECLRDSLKALEGYRLGRKPIPSEWNEVFGVLFAIVSDITGGHISPATAETLLRAISFEREILAARREGEIAGRNTRIEEQLRQPVKGDGLPSLRGAVTSTPASPRRSQSIFDLAGEAR